MISRTKTAFLLALCSYQVCVATQMEQPTPGTRAHHRFLEGRGPNGECLQFPPKDRLCLLGNILYMVNSNGSISKRDLSATETTSFQPTALVCQLQEGGIPTKLHMLDDKSAVVEARYMNGSSIHFCNQSNTIHITSSSKHAWLSGISSDRRYVFFNTSGPKAGTQEWVNQVCVYDTTEQAYKMLPHAPAHSNPHFGWFGLECWINRSHTGEQAIHVVNPMTSALETVYSNTLGDVVLVGYSPREQAAMVVKYEKEHWLPYVVKRDHTCQPVLTGTEVIQGDVLHFQYEGADQPIFLSERLPDGTTRHHLLNATGTLLEQDVNNVMQVVAGRSVVKGPELNGGISAVATMQLLYLIVADKAGVTSIIEAKRPEAGAPFQVKNLDPITLS